MMRGLTEVDEIMPKVEDVTLVLGLPNCDVLKALKNSVRNSTLAFSRSRLTGVCLMIARSKFRWSGPKAMPTPLLPNAVARPSAPTIGQMAEPAALRRTQPLLK